MRDFRDTKYVSIVYSDIELVVEVTIVLLNGLIYVTCFLLVLCLSLILMINNIIDV